VTNNSRGHRIVKEHKDSTRRIDLAVAAVMARCCVDGGDGAATMFVAQNAQATGTDIAGYLTESPGFSTFVREGEDVYHAYSTTWRGLEFVMTYYPILDHAPKGRDEGDDDWQLWIRRHDEYDSE
jgi:predicted dithiol-disulfide oxidoreductase (DUF899 family)